MEKSSNKASKVSKSTQVKASDKQDQAYSANVKKWCLLRLQGN